MGLKKGREVLFFAQLEEVAETFDVPGHTT